MRTLSILSARESPTPTGWTVTAISTEVCGRHGARGVACSMRCFILVAAKHRINRTFRTGASIAAPTAVTIESAAPIAADSSGSHAKAAGAVLARGSTPDER